MDTSPFLTLKPAPRVLFDALPERHDRVRYWLPAPGGGWRAVTWQAHAEDVRRVALGLASLGLEPGERAAIFAPNSVEWMAAALGIQATGGVMVPVYASNTSEQAAYVVAHSDARVVFVDTPELLARLWAAWGELAHVSAFVLLSPDADPRATLAAARALGGALPPEAEIGGRLVGWTELLARGEAHAEQHPGAFARRLEAVGLDQPGVMLYTSGTSGPPKGVPLTHRNVGSNGRDWLQCNGPLVEIGDVDVLWLPMSHIFGFGEACLGNTLGFESYLAAPKDALAVVREVRPQVFMSVPAVWEKIALSALAAPDPAARRAKLAEITGGRMRFCLSGGAGLKREIKEELHAMGLLIIEGYGLTESSPTLTLNRPDAFRFDTVGKPLPSVALRLAEDGEIQARGDNVFAGYHKDPEASAGAFTEDGWLKTGDLGRFTEDGFLQIIGRKKDILVTAGGKNVAPANIEGLFAGDPLVAHAVVYGDARPYLVACIWVDGAEAERLLAARGVAGSERGAALERWVAERIEAANAKLARYETIKRFAIVDEALTVEGGMLTPTLKVRRAKVYEKWQARFEELYR